MFAQRLVICLLAFLLAAILSGSQLLAAPGRPFSPGARPCTWGDLLDPHGTVRYSPVSFQGSIARFALYRCQDASWVYIGASDDVMP